MPTPPSFFHFVNIAVSAAFLFLFQFALAQAESQIKFPKKELKVEAIPLGSFGSYSSPSKKIKPVFLTGHILKSENKNFGGFSGLRVLDNGTRLFTVSDRGHFLGADLERDKKGKIIKLSNVVLSCICGRDGKPYKKKKWHDAEGLEITGDEVFISFERLHRINRYPFKLSNQPGKPEQATASFTRKNFKYNKGLEALARFPASPNKETGKENSLLAIAENSLNPNGNHRGFIADKNTIEEFEIVKSGEYAITDATFMDDGKLLVLERRYGFPYGIGMRIRLFDSEKIKKGALLKGETVLEAGVTSQIDNMEGITVYKNTSGKNRLLLISDDNFSDNQNTILLEFEF